MLEKRRVLVIDDDREIVRGVRIRLQAAGYEVLTAYDGQAGLAACFEHRPDVVVLDVRMPVMDGLAVLAALKRREETKAIPVVVLSARVVAREKATALELGARFFLGKPYDATSLMAAIATAIATPARDAPSRVNGMQSVADTVIGVRR
jgi:CheY-like chemotaxis protein